MPEKPQIIPWQDRFTLSEGMAVLTWPGHMSEESFREFEEWIRLVLRRTERESKRLHLEDYDA